MKINFLKKLTLFLLISFFVASCTLEKPENPKPEISQIILEVTNNYQGMWDVTGEMLQLRLFDNGIVEYDDIIKPPSKSFTDSENIKVTKQFKIDKAKVKEIIDFLSSEDFLNTEELYTRKCCCTDAVIDTKFQSFLTDKRKIATVKNHCDDLKNPDSRYLPNFPTAISQLDRKIWEIRSKVASDNFHDQPNGKD